MATAGEAVQGTLGALQDVAGVEGSFVMTAAGALVARALPAMFDDGVLGEIGDRLARLRDTFAAVGDEVDIAVLRFSDHKLYVKILPGGALCILAGAAVNMPALRMAANLVGRRVAPELERAERELAAVAPPPVVAPTTASGPVPAAAVRRFRGRVVE